MSLAIAAFAAGLAVAVAKGILGKEIQGRIERRIARSVEATIASLPDTLQAEYADEWRAELAATIAMPLTAAAFARGLRRTAARLLPGSTAIAGATRTRERVGGGLGELLVKLAVVGVYLVFSVVVLATAVAVVTMAFGAETGTIAFLLLAGPIVRGSPATVFLASRLWDLAVRIAR